MPRFLGQHFLKNEAVIKKIVAAIDPQSGDVILEVGPGHGELTLPLAAAAEKKGAKLIAVERDKKLAEALRNKPAIGNVEVLEGDILAFLSEGARGFNKITGNIPYYLTGHLLRKVGEIATKSITTSASCERAIFMIQKEVAERICEAPPRMNRLAASVQFWAEPKIIAQVSRKDFSPPPEVDSVVIQLDRTIHANIAAENYYAAVRALFAQPRKTIFNNLAAALEDNAHGEPGKRKMSREVLTAALVRIEIDPKLRPQNLSSEEIIRIATHLTSVYK